MIRSFTLGILISISSFLYGQEKSIPTDSKIEKVIVFLQGAQIERTASVSIPAGASTIVFHDLSPDIEEQSIQVKGAGDFTILSVNRQSNFLNEQKINEGIKTLEAKVSSLKDEIDIKQNSNTILSKEEAMLQANQSIGNGGAGLDLNKLKQALEFQKERLTDNKLKQLSNRKSIEKLTEEVDKLEKQIKEERGKAKNNTTDIEVKVSSKTVVSGSFRITYLVKNATWFPTYDIRATDVNKPIELIYRANVSQQSGEEWKNVKLVLSSGNPSKGGNKPALKPYRIGYNVSYYTPASNISAVSGRITDAQNNSPLAGVTIRVKGTSIGATSDTDGRYSIQIPSANAVLQYVYVGYETSERLVLTQQVDVQLKPAIQSLSEVVVVGYGNQKNVSSALAGATSGIRIRGTSTTVPLEVEVQQNQTTVQFEVARPYSVSTDGKQLTVELANHQLDADYKYYAVPKLSEDVYLTATAKGISELNLMSGEANIFFEGAFLGKTLIDVQNTSDTLSVSLGADRNLVVKRIRQKEQNEKSFIGANQRATRAFNYEILSRKQVPVTLSLEDQIPVSTGSEVSVERLELSNAKVDEDTGLLTWNMQLQPNEKKQLKMIYQVKYPKNRPLRLE